MTDLTARFTPTVLDAVAQAIAATWSGDRGRPSPPLLRLAHPASRHPLAAPARAALAAAFSSAGRSGALVNEFGRRHLTPERTETGLTSLSPSRSAAADVFGHYIGSTDGYYVVPNGLFLTAIGDHPERFSVDAVVTDLGAGTGRHGLASALAGAQVELVEPSRAGCDFARRQAAELDLGTVVVREGDARDWSPPSASRDAVVAITVLEHVPRADRTALADVITDSLKPGGVLVAKVFLDDDPGALGEAGKSDTAGYVSDYFAPGELRAMFSGLDAVVSREVKWLDTGHGAPHYHSAAELVALRG